MEEVRIYKYSSKDLSQNDVPRSRPSSSTLLLFVYVLNKNVPMVFRSGEPAMLIHTGIKLQVHTSV